MAQITGGTVSVEDGLKSNVEYQPPRKVRVDLSFSVAEGENYETVFDMASQAASNRVSALLHGTALNVVQAAAQAGATAAEEPARRTRRTKAEMEAARAAAGNTDPAAVSEDPTGGEDPVIHLPDASAVTDEDPASIGSDGGAQTSADPADVTFADEDEGGDEWDVNPEPAKEITDAELNSLVQKRNGELGAPALIRELIGSYNPDKSKPFQLRQIPQADRAGFIDKLAGLKKPAA